MKKIAKLALMVILLAGCSEQVGHKVDSQGYCIEHRTTRVFGITVAQHETTEFASRFRFDEASKRLVEAKGGCTP